MMEHNAWLSPVTFVSLLGGLVVLVVKLTRVYKWFTFFQSLPGEEEFSLIYGNLHKIPKTGDGRLQYGVDQMYVHSRRFHRLWFGPLTPIIYVYHPELTKTILKSSAPKSRGFGSLNQLVSAWIGGGVVVSNGKKWARTRRLLSPAFHFDILKPYTTVFNRGADSLFKKLDTLAKTGESFNICPLITLYTLESVLECAFSHRADIQTHGHPYATAIQEILDILIDRMKKPWLWFDWAFRQTSKGRTFYKHCHFVHKFAEDTIKQRREVLVKEGVPKSRYPDFIDILLTAEDEDGNSMSDLEIRQEVDTFMFGGHDTTASAIPWCLYMLAKHPEYQVRIQEEVDAILDGRDNDEIKWSDLPALETLTMCIKESIRLYSPVPFIQRQIQEKVEFDGHVIPPGTFMTIAIYHLHRNPDLWEEPEEFRPSRFQQDNGQRKQDPFSYIPFSAGSRNCIGKTFALNEIKVLLGRILRRYRIEVAADHAPPTLSATIVLRAENGIWFKLQRRDKES